MYLATVSKWVLYINPGPACCSYIKTKYLPYKSSKPERVSARIIHLYKIRGVVFGTVERIHADTP